MHVFSIAAETNYQRLHGLKHKFTILQFYKLEVQHKSYWAKIKVLVGYFFFSGIPIGKFVALTLLASGSYLHSLSFSLLIPSPKTARAG